MAIKIGQQLGSYEITSFLGKGGMGEVYCARDTRLHRTVAIKVLSSDKTADPERKLRFLQEARAASAMNHPNIVTLHDMASDDGVPYLVMEYVPGKSLDKLITPKGLPLDEVISYAMQIADALAAAHAQGIVHRDVKPANIMVTPSSLVKILDFGLAKLTEYVAEDAETATYTPTLTEAGAVIGTVDYMSPEQANGRPLDYRTDIFSFGVVLYEMIAGRKPFDAKSRIATMNAIVSDPVPPLKEPRPQFEEIFEKAMAKDPRDRYQHVGDLGLDLRRLKGRRQPESVPSAESAAASRTRRSIAFALLPVVVGIALLAGLWLGRRPSAESALRRDASLFNLASYSGTERSGAISPDGKFFAFVSDRGGQPDIWVRQVSGGDPLQVTHDPAAKLDLTYAPDGDSIYYSTAAPPRTIWRVGVLGGTPRKIVEDARFPAPSPDGQRLAFVSSSEGIAIANTDGTGTHQIASVLGAQYVQWSPDGHWLAYTAGSLFDTYQISVIDPEGKNKKQVTSFPIGTILCIGWLPNSRDVVFAYNPAPAPDSADLLSATIEGGEIRRLTLVPKGTFTSCSVSGDGKRLVGTTLDTESEIWQAPLSGDPKANGKAATRLLDHAWEPMWIQAPRAGMLLFNSPATGIRNLWIMPLDQAGAPRQITFFPISKINHAALSPDGGRVAYVSMESGSGQIWVANADGSGARQLTNNKATNFWPFWSSDGRWVAFTSMRPGPADIWKVDASGGTPPMQVTHSNAFRGDWSPDGQRIAYDTLVLQGGPLEREQRANSIEIAEASTGKLLRKVSAANLQSPVWNSDGTRLTATTNNAVWMIDAETGERHLAVEFPQDFLIIFRAAWSPDGKSVMVNRQERVNKIVLLENFWAP